MKIKRFLFVVLIIFSIGICYVGAAEALEYTGPTQIGNMEIQEQSISRESNALICFALGATALLAGMMLYSKK